MQNFRIFKLKNIKYYAKDPHARKQQQICFYDKKVNFDIPIF
jgi:hypothetical protein